MNHLIFIFALIAGFTATDAIAQTAPTELTAEQKEAIAKQDTNMANAAYVVAQMVDNGELVDLWEGMSADIKPILPQAEFISQLQQRRNPLGTVQSRLNPMVTRAQVNSGDSIPQGIYINVKFTTTFSNQKNPVNELISFHLDKDNIWRVSGYSIQ